MANPPIDVHSPYYLHPNENPGANLVTASLVGSNYHSWSQAMWRSLKTKNKHGFVDGSLPNLQLMILYLAYGIAAILW